MVVTASHYKPLSHGKTIYPQCLTVIEFYLYTKVCCRLAVSWINKFLDTCKIITKMLIQIPFSGEGYCRTRWWWYVQPFSSLCKHTVSVHAWAQYIDGFEHAPPWEIIQVSFNKLTVLKLLKERGLFVFFYVS